MNLVRKDFQEARLHPADIPNVLCSDDIWVIDLFQGPTIPTEPRATETMIFVAQDYITHYVIFAKVIRKDEQSRETFARIFSDNIHTDSCWPNLICCGKNASVNEAGLAFLQLQGNRSEPTCLVNDRSGHFRYPLDEFHRAIELADPKLDFVPSNHIMNWLQDRVDEVTRAYNCWYAGNYYHLKSPDVMLFH